MDFVDIDGSQGEGGGQILRTAVVFSVVKKRPVRISKIRAGRSEPGLKQQHASALNLFKEVFDAKVTGVAVGSSEVTFVPGPPKAIFLAIDMKTAASITLVLQAVVPAVALSGWKLDLKIVGGTDVPWSPTYDYFDLVLRPAFAAIGIVFRSEVLKRGYYPRGGGQVKVQVEPSHGVDALELAQPSHAPEVGIVSRSALLPKDVAQRQLAAAAEILEGGHVDMNRRGVFEAEADSPGSSILVYSVSDGVFVGGDSIGSRGKPSEEVGTEAAEMFLRAAKVGASLDSNAADMVIPLLALASGRSRLFVPGVSSHLATGISLAKQFTGREFKIEKFAGGILVSVG